jgi:succinate dehydrogenase/fumarate reductase flavoprotein subunit
LCAAYEAGKQGIQVIVLEKQAEFGGNGKSALTGINMVGTYAQDARALTDSISNFKKDIYYAGCTTTPLPLLSASLLMALLSRFQSK